MNIIFSLSIPPRIYLHNLTAPFPKGIASYLYGTQTYPNFTVLLILKLTDTVNYATFEYCCTEPSQKMQ